MTTRIPTWTSPCNKTTLPLKTLVVHDFHSYKYGLCPGNGLTETRALARLDHQEIASDLAKGHPMFGITRTKSVFWNRQHVLVWVNMKGWKDTESVLTWQCDCKCETGKTFTHWDNLHLYKHSVTKSTPNKHSKMCLFWSLICKYPLLRS